MGNLDKLRSVSMTKGLSLPWMLFFTALIYTVVTVVTEPATLSDTLVYVNDAQGALQGREWKGRFNPLWEFGHLLWRPLAYWIAPACLAVIPDSLAHNDSLKITLGLIWINWMAGLLTTLTTVHLASRWVRSSNWLLLLGLSYAASSAFLLYTQTGSSYVVSLFLLTAAVWILFHWPDGRIPPEVPAGLLLGLSVAFWFPFALVAPATLLFRSIERRKLLLVPVMVGGMSFTVLLGSTYLFGAVKAGAHDMASFLAWYEAAKHTWDQNRQWLRAISGVVRLLYELGQDGVLLKRFSFRDPYSPVNWVDLLPTALRMASFYSLCLFSLSLAWWQKQFRHMVLVFGLAAIPMLYFAIVLFEPSSAERFLPLLPFLFLSIVAASQHPSKLGRTVLALLLISIPISNLPPAFSFKREHPAEPQLRDFRRFAQGGDVMVTATHRDPLVNLVEQHPFLSVNRAGAPASYQLIEVASSRAALWREDFARKVLASWPNQHVWIQLGMLDARPPAALGWVEGDNPSIHWKDILDFFAELDLDLRTAERNGFARLARSAANSQVLEALAKRK